jgi:hypothetical protein
MNQEDRILLEQLNEVIAHNPHLRAYQLSLRTQHSRKTSLLKTWLIGFIVGAIAATASIAVGNRIGLQGNPGTDTEKSSELPVQPASND